MTEIGEGRSLVEGLPLQVTGPVAQSGRIKRLASFFGHVINMLFALVVLASTSGEGLSLDICRAMYLVSLAILIASLYQQRSNVFFLARTACLAGPGYFSAGVQLRNPNLLYSHYEVVSQTLDISMMMYALTNLALAGSAVGFWLGARPDSRIERNDQLSTNLYFYGSILPLLAVAYYVSLTYGESLFVASYATGTSALTGAMGAGNTLGGIFLLIMFEALVGRPSRSRFGLFILCAAFFLIYAMLIRGGRQDVISCLFGMYIVFKMRRGQSPSLSGPVALAALAGAVFMEYVGYIRGNVLGLNFDYSGQFREFVNFYMHQQGVIHFGTLSPIATTFANTLYALKNGFAQFLNGRGYWEYILRIPPEFISPNRPRDYAWIMVDWDLKAGGGFFELAEAYFNFGVVGAALMPFIVSFAFARIYDKYSRRGGVAVSVVFFAILSIFLRGALYQTFAYFRALTVAAVLIAGENIIRRSLYRVPTRAIQSGR